MILQIPLSNIPNQLVAVDLEGKHCVFEFVTRDDKMYANQIIVDDELKASGIACLNRNNLLDLFNSGLSGRLFFLDMNGDESPKYVGLNNRWLFLYEVE